MNQKTRTFNSIINMTVNLAAKIVGLICSFVIRTLFLRYLGVEYTGISTLFTDILHILSFTELGIGTAVSYAFYKPIANNDEQRILQLLKLYKKIYFAISLAIICIGLAIIPFLDYIIVDQPNIKENLVVVYLFYLIKTALSYLMIYKSTFLIAKQKQYIVTTMETVCLFGKSVIEILILITTKSFVLYLIVELLSVMVSNIIISYCANREIPNYNKIQNVQINKADFNALFKNVKDIVIYKINGIILNSTDSIITSVYLGTKMVGYIANYYLLFNSVANVACNAISAATASIGNFASLKTEKEQEKLFKMISLLYFFVVCIMVIGMMLCTNPFIELLWGKEYLLSYDVVLALAMNLFITSMHIPVNIFREANGVFEKGKYRPVATAIINLVVSIIAAPKMGVIGVILGTVIARALTQMWYDPKLIYNHIFKMSVRPYYITYLKYVLVVFVNGCIGIALINQIPNVVVKFIFGFFYATIGSIISCIITWRKTYEFEDIKEYVLRFIKR